MSGAAIICSEGASCFLFKSPHQLAQCVWHPEGLLLDLLVPLGIKMPKNGEPKRRTYLHEMSSYGERSRFLYGKMCCVGELSNLIDRVGRSCLFPAWWKHVIVTLIKANWTGVGTCLKVIKCWCNYIPTVPHIVWVALESLFNVCKVIIGWINIVNL